MEVQSFSPTPVVARARSLPVQMNFYDALRELVGGKRITKLEWNSAEFYGILSETHLKLHRPDGKLYDWVLTDGDMVGTDWIILS